MPNVDRLKWSSAVNNLLYDGTRYLPLSISVKAGGLGGWSSPRIFQPSLSPSHNFSPSQFLTFLKLLQRFTLFSRNKIMLTGYKFSAWRQNIVFNCSKFWRKSVFLYEKSLSKKVFQIFVLSQNCWAPSPPIDDKVLRLCRRECDSLNEWCGSGSGGGG